MADAWLPVWTLDRFLNEGSSFRGDYEPGACLWQCWRSGTWAADISAIAKLPTAPEHNCGLICAVFVTAVKPEYCGPQREDKSLLQLFKRNGSPYRTTYDNNKTWSHKLVRGGWKTYTGLKALNGASLVLVYGGRLAHP